MLRSSLKGIENSLTLNWTLGKLESSPPSANSKIIQCVFQLKLYVGQTFQLNNLYLNAKGVSFELSRLTEV